MEEENWQRGEHGGVHWSLSSGWKKIFVPVGDMGNHQKAIGDSRSGVYAYDPFSGDELWSYDAVINCFDETFEILLWIFSSPCQPMTLCCFGNLNGILYAISTKKWRASLKIQYTKEFQSINLIPVMEEPLMQLAYEYQKNDLYQFRLWRSMVNYQAMH